MFDIKRELEELVAIYSFEEELVDIYVEGPTDKFIIENYCEYKRVKEINIIEIDTIDLSELQAKFSDLNLRSNKDKLIALSRILDLNKISTNITCIVDKDFDGIINEFEKNKHLKYTDYSCMESYFYCRRHIEKIIKIGIRNFPIDTDVILKEVSKILWGLFVLRMVNHKFELNHEFPKIENNMPIDKVTGLCNFDFDNYLSKYITKNGLMTISTKIQEFIDEVRKKMDPDIKYNMNGHDFIKVLFNYINKIKNTPNFKLSTFERAVILSIQPDYLEEYGLFKAICS
ncbi:DUF4435 domain-containing protein [Prolixibacter sp. NT017]|uniref:DUF4435 domain-containing protein n=1 Tax=Prolixibacter sp. NT017 TaxID=2652390 RepID=UPI0012885C2E|nr:DUF4435 domain-containing protein [Prolixibacter sp. NT017]GET24944.1 hypothetical protein NT017_12730 [Prolixibacter sp. NT017]